MLYCRRYGSVCVILTIRFSFTVSMFVLRAVYRRLAGSVFVVCFIAVSVLNDGLVAIVVAIVVIINIF
jgi:hypothetical protein